MPDSVDWPKDDQSSMTVNRASSLYRQCHARRRFVIRLTISRSTRSARRNQAGPLSDRGLNIG